MKGGLIVGGRYRAERILGTGFVAHVLAGGDIESGRRVAIKVPRPRDAEGSSLALLRREAAILARVKSPFLPELLAAGGEDEASAYLVMPLYEGEPLEVIAARGPLALADLAPFLVAAAGALDALHEAGFVHCDVKPANLLRAVGDAPGIKLIDFNVALPIGADTGGQFTGSPPYMAPELWRGDPVSPSTDVYALGAMVASLLSGEPLFLANSQLQWMRAHLDETPSLEALSPSLAAVVAPSLAKDPAERPSRAGEFARRILAGGT